MATPPQTPDYGSALGPTSTTTATGDVRAGSRNIINFVPDGPVAMGDQIMGNSIPWNSQVTFVGPASIVLSIEAVTDEQGARFAILHKLTQDSQLLS